MKNSDISRIKSQLTTETRKFIDTYCTALRDEDEGQENSSVEDRLADMVLYMIEVTGNKELRNAFRELGKHL
jgi:hypothetical protein